MPVEPCGGACGVPKTGSWPDRSALTSAMGKVVFECARAPLSGVGCFGHAASLRLGGLAGPFAPIGGLDLGSSAACGPVRVLQDRAREQIANRGVHGTPSPRGAGEAGDTAAPGCDNRAQGHPALGHCLSAERVPEPYNEPAQSDSRECLRPGPPKRPGEQKRPLSRLQLPVYPAIAKPASAMFRTNGQSLRISPLQAPEAHLCVWASYLTLMIR